MTGPPRLRNELDDRYIGACLPEVDRRTDPVGDRDRCRSAAAYPSFNPPAHELTDDALDVAERRSSADAKDNSISPVLLGAFYAVSNVPMPAIRRPPLKQIDRGELRSSNSSSANKADAGHEGAELDRGRRRPTLRQAAGKPRALDVCQGDASSGQRWS